MPFYHVRSLLSRDLLLGEQPFEHVCTCTIPDDVRFNKDRRQEWYKLTSTEHYFYTGVEPQVATLRPSETNPPFRIHAVAADYDDLQLHELSVTDGIKHMKHPPTWIERSLGNNWRLIWEFEKGVMVAGDGKFATFFLESLIPKLSLEAIPRLDRKAFVTFSRLLCHGGKPWTRYAKEPLASHTVHSWLVEAVKEYSKFNSSAEEQCIPLEDVEKALKEKFGDKFSWPGPFVVGSQGPSFWVKGSTSPMSAILKPWGFYTFAAHAEQACYTWGHSELLGAEFVESNTAARLEAATRNVYVTPNEVYFRLDEEKQQVFPYTRAQMNVYLKVQCKLKSDKPKGALCSQTELALNHIKEHNYVSEAGPEVFSKPGIYIKNGMPVLNTYCRKPMEPATGTQKFGPHGEFPVFSKVFEALLSPDEKQLAVYAAWAGYAFNCAVNWDPKPGVAMILAGGRRVGKTLLNRHATGTPLGGFFDANRLLISNNPFSSSELEHPFLALDDDAVNDFESEQRATAALKKLVGNQEARYEKKYHSSMMVEYMGRIGVTMNMDYRTTKLLANVDSFLAGKVSVLKCILQPAFEMPSREEMAKHILRETPHWMRWCMDFKPPDYVLPDASYGWAAYLQPDLMKEAAHSSRWAPFVELLVDCLSKYFTGEPEATEWRGTQTQVYSMLKTYDPGILRGIREQTINQRLEQIHEEKLLQCSWTHGPMGSRIWTFPRSAVQAVLPSTDTVIATQTNSALYTIKS